MKKLMFAAVAMAACVAMADGEIASDNIVGYVNKTPDALTSIFAPSFNNITDGTLKLTDIKPVRSGQDPIESGDISLQTMDENGAAEATIYYLLAGEADVGSPEGWYWETMEPCDKVFDFGEGIIMTCPYEDATFNSSGEVDTETRQFTPPALTCIWGNTRPAPVAIADVTVARTSGDPIESGDISLQTMDENGAAEATIYYLLAGEADVGSPEGWYWETMELCDKELGIGEAIIMTCPYEDAVFTLPELDTTPVAE